mmetsp:Transcript_49504/g.97867  ORF Transcript_49504/g.97867 Transcript_49504/m.97867 type:complete len:563 (-) Transcript_49504:159-1847(-)|eukprot:CAMPEP_0171702034 /NCGR_PEP_ID=MMETSP0991-20121206/11380_1 /TAXON_ID=483369 /ORGANISM="non described non described, Strain CCMP2098" /LENGTH=562 /DNA_ID=CAMNT_0012291349 /DNA_START=92 /DNA_END=1780 /DNA_ORIENTATION=-
MTFVSGIIATALLLSPCAHASNDYQLGHKIRAIVERPEFKSCKWGIMAQETNTSIRDGGLIYANSGASLFSVPASNGKLPTTFAAWLSLGPNYQFETSIGVTVADDGRTGSSVNVTLCGANDPSLTSPQLQAAAIEAISREPLIKAAAFVRVRVDNRRGSDATFPGSWEWGDLQFDYGAAPASVILDGNVVPVVVEPSGGGSIGALAVVSLPAPGSNECFAVVNEVVTAPMGESSSVSASFEVRSGLFSLVLSGSVAVASGTRSGSGLTRSGAHRGRKGQDTAVVASASGGGAVELEVSCRDPLRRAGDALVEFLREGGAPNAAAAAEGEFVVTDASECDGGVAGHSFADRVGFARAAPATALSAAATMTSERLEILLNHTLLESDNTYAEAIFRRQGPDGSYARSMEAVRATLAAWEPAPALAAAPHSTHSGLASSETNASTTASVLDLEEYSAVDGSGLSRHDLVTPAFLASLLSFADQRYVSLLPLAGVSGTLSDRFKGTAAEGRLRAKTGTMTNVNALSGVVGSVAFSILSDSCPQPPSTVRQGIDEIAVLFAELDPQ